MDTHRLDVMNFLNEAVSRYPYATSFASGRPSEKFFNVREILSSVPIFLDYYANQAGLKIEKAWEFLGQYGPTVGLIRDLISKQLAKDNGIHSNCDQIAVTAGCQEGMALCLSCLCQDRRDVLLVRNPTYIGITGAAITSNVRIHALRDEHSVGIVQSILVAASEVEAQGGRVRVLYLTPDFNNPTGETLSRRIREDIIEHCANRSIYILEDNPYGLFRFEGAHVPTMYSLDRHDRVIYLGTYSKTFCPTVRVGYIVLPMTLLSAGMMAEISQRKSFGSLNTSQLMQAAIGGTLINENFTLARRIAPAIEFYRQNRDTMLAGIDAIAKMLNGKIACNSPSGGFFITLNVPGPFLRSELEICAQKNGVVVMPTSFFSFDNAHDCAVRLAYSNVSPSEISDGMIRFGNYLADRYCV